MFLIHKDCQSLAFCKMFLVLFFFLGGGEAVLDLIGYTICSAEFDSSHIVGIFRRDVRLLICLFDEGLYAICYRFQCLVMSPIVSTTLQRLVAST